MRYMSPEVANSQDYNHKAEAYSFASVLWEMCSHTKPFTEFSSPELFKEEVAKGFHPKINPKWPADLQSLLKDCWALEIPQRPEFCQVVLVLELLLQNQMEAAGNKK
jgi:serine/threonine-protein kinase TNNI3K